MNTKIFRQYDGPWAKKPYPTKGCTVSGAGCGLVACTHMAIEQERYKNWTPETLRPYMLQYAVAGQGTTWNGIRKTLEHLGYKVTHISESTPMKDAFAELNKGNRIGIILFYGGYSKRYKKWYRTPDGTVWTGNGHYIMFANYKYENGNHWFYMKDSGGRKHDGWYSYEKSMKGCVGQMWIAERVGTQTTSHKATTADGKLVVDGNGGVATVKAMQRFFGVTQDGVISSQNKNLKRFYPAFKSVSYSDNPKGSLTVEKMQTWLGISPDGILGKQSVTALQKKLGVTADGILGAATMKAWQKYLNEHDKAVYPKQSIIDKEMEACKVQAEWMKNYTYDWGKWSPRNVEMSKKYGTCITYVACVLQRIGIFKSGEFIWQNGKGYGTGKVHGANNKMTVTYMGNKTFTACKSKLQRGDIVMVDDNKSGHPGSGGHIMIFSGKWASDGSPYVWDNNSCDRLRKGKSALTAYGKNRKILAIARLKDSSKTAATKGDKIAATAKKYIGKVPYILGGHDITKGVDCTGFIQEVYRLNSINLDNKLSSWGKSIGTDISKAKPGDIVTYKKNGKISHHAIYIGNKQVVHAANPKSGVIKSGVNISGMSIEGIRRRWSPGK